MRRLTLYILRQIVGPFALFTVLLTLVVWLTQSLRLLDLVINRGQSAATFAYLTLLMLPSLLVVIIPVAFFGAALYALHKLNNDSEMVVMWSAGVSRLQLALPVLIAAGVAMFLTYACALWLMPAGQRAMREKVFDIRADIGAAILREGAFVVPTNGLTVFIREIRPAGEIRGILVHDNRNPERPMTFLAESGMLAQTTEGARLIMSNGNVQQVEQEGARLSVVSFDNYVFDLDQFAGPQRASERETSERSLGELLWPEVTGPGAELRRAVYRAEAHNRLSSPLYCLAFALLALAATASGHMARGSYVLRLVAAGLGGAVLRMIGYAVQGAAARNPYLSFLLYLVPLSGIVFAACIMAQVPMVPAGLKRRMARSLPEFGMNWSMTLNAYLARRFGAAVLMVFTAIALLGMSIDLAELFRRTTDKDIATAVVFSMSLLKLPDLAQKLLPFAVLFGAIIAFARLSRNHELVATRAAGISVWQFLTMPLLVALGIGIVTATVFNPVSAALLAQYARMEARHIQGQASQLDVSSAGLWLRQGAAEQQSVIHALRVADQGTHLEDVMVLLYDGVDRFAGRIDAARADLGEGSWNLSEAWISNEQGVPVYHASYRMPTDLTAAQIEESFASPSTISFWELPRFIATAESAGFSALRHRIYWYSLLTLPILLAAMVIVAAGFSFRLARLGGMTQLLFLGALAGLGVYFLQDVTQAMALGGILPPPLAALAPSLGAIFLGTALLLHEEDG